MNLREQFLSAWTESYSASADVERYVAPGKSNCGATGGPGPRGGGGFTHGNDCGDSGGSGSSATQQAAGGAGDPQERPGIRRKAAPAFANSIQKMLYDHKLKTGEDRKESREEIASHLMTSSDKVDRMSEQVYRDVESQVKSAGDGAAVDLKNNVELLEEMIDAVDPDGTYYGRGGQYEQRKQQEAQQQKASEKRQEDVKARRQEPDGNTPPGYEKLDEPRKPNYKGALSNLHRVAKLAFQTAYGDVPPILRDNTKLARDWKKAWGLNSDRDKLKDSAAAKPIDQMNRDELKIQTKDALRQHLKDVGGKPLSSDTRHVLSQKILDARSGGLKETPLSEMGHAELKTQSRDMLKDELRSLGVKPRSGDTRHGLATKIMEARATQSRQMQVPLAPSPEGGETESSTAPQRDVSNDYDLPNFNIQDAINDYKKQYTQFLKTGDLKKLPPELRQLENRLSDAGVEIDADFSDISKSGAKAKFKHEGVSDAIKGWNKAVKDGDDVAAGQLRDALAGVGIDVESAAERHKAKPDRAEVLGKSQDWLNAYRSGDKDAASAIQEEMSGQGYDVKQMVSDAIKKRREAQASTATEEPPAVEPAQEPVEEPVQDAREDMVEAKEPAAEMPTTDEGIDSDVEDLKVGEPAAEGPFFDSEGLEFDTQEEADANSQAIAEERRIRDEEKAKRPDANWKWDEEGLPVFDRDTDADVDNLKVEDPGPADAPEAPAEAIPQEDLQDQAEDKQVAPEPEEASREAGAESQPELDDESAHEIASKANSLFEKLNRWTDSTKRQLEDLQQHGADFILNRSALATLTYWNAQIEKQSSEIMEAMEGLPEDLKNTARKNIEGNTRDLKERIDSEINSRNWGHDNPDKAQEKRSSYAEANSLLLDSSKYISYPIFDKKIENRYHKLKEAVEGGADSKEVQKLSGNLSDAIERREDSANKVDTPKPEEAVQEAEPQGESIYSDEDKALANKTIKPRSNLDKAIVDQIGDNAYDHKVFKEYVNEAQKMYEETREDFNNALRESLGTATDPEIRAISRRATGSKRVKQREELWGVVGKGFDHATDFLRNHPDRLAALAAPLNASFFVGDSSTGSIEEILHEALKFGLMGPANPEKIVKAAWAMAENYWPHEDPSGEMLMNIEAGIDIKKPAGTEGDDPYEIPFSAYLMAEIDKYDSTHIVEIDLTGHEHTPGVQDQLFSDLFTSHWNWSRSFIA